MNTEKVIEDKVMELGKVSEETKGVVPNSIEGASFTHGLGA